MPQKRLIILGSSVTALAVVRNAAAMGLVPVVLDTRNDIAFQSSHVQKILCVGKTDSEVLATVLELGQAGRHSLMASSDRWIDFVMANRPSLEIAFDTVLHASNDVLAICTDKLKFAHWCDTNAVAAPRLYHLNTQGSLSEPVGDFPFLVRPYKGTMNVAANGLPKAVEVNDQASLQRCLQSFQDAQVQPIVTRSLLGLTLTQYSVGLARTSERMVSFVAEKVRPTADQCAVGSYVVLRENSTVEKMARDVADRLDYFGVAEFEILHAQETGEDFLIEINVRPWIQYGLGTRSGHNFLQVLLDGSAYDSSLEKKSGMCWIDFNDDLFNCFSRSVGVVRNGEVSIFTYLGTLLRANAFAKWCISDQRPFWHTIGQLIASSMGRSDR